MTDQELLERAIEFDLGPELIVNGRLLNPEYTDTCQYHVSVKLKSSKPKRWAIVNLFGNCLSKQTGEWLYESMPSNRTDEFKDETRFDSLQEAIAFYEKWKQAILKWVQKEVNLYGPKVVLNLPDNVMELP